MSRRWRVRCVSRERATSPSRPSWHSAARLAPRARRRPRSSRCSISSARAGPTARTRSHGARDDPGRMTAPFTAPHWLANRHAQTLYAALLAPAPRVAFRRERWDTPDGDFVDVDFVEGVPGSPWVHLYHGLEGSSNSPYAR